MYRALQAIADAELESARRMVEAMEAVAAVNPRPVDEPRVEYSTFDAYLQRRVGKTSTSEYEEWTNAPPRRFLADGVLRLVI